MQKYFLDLKGWVEANYPDFQGNIEGGVYPPPKYAEVIAQLSGYVWMAGVAFLVGGEQIFKALSIKEPEWYNWAKNNRMVSFLVLFMLNNFGHSFLATGAFEVYVNDELMYSKLELHKMPSTGDFMRLLAVRGYEAAYA
jgi:selT/selW/selH-like putative selenoprotein